MTVICENIAMYAAQYSFQKELPLYGKHKGTVLWYALAMDNADVFQVLSEHGIKELYSNTDLLNAAIEFNSSQCIECILEESVSLLEGKLAMESLYEACKKGINLVDVLLKAGASFDKAFCEKYPNVLQKYYTYVGMTDVFKEASCTEFTRLVLESYGCSKYLKNSIDYSLFAKLMVRATRNMKSFLKDDIDAFYADIISCIKLLVKHNENLPNEVEDAVEMSLNAIYHKHRFADVQGSISNHMNFIELLLELGFKPNGGYCCPLLLLVKLPAPFLDGTHSPSKVFADDFLHLTEIFLQKGCSPNSVGSYGRPVLHRFMEHMFTTNLHNTESFTFRVDLFTRMVDLLCSAGLNPNISIIHSSPADSFRHSNHTTYFQNLVALLDPIKHLQRDDVVQLVRPILNIIVLFAGERVQFAQEFQSINFKTAMCLLGTCFVKCTSNPFMQEDQSAPRLTAASIAVAKVAGYLLSLMIREHRRKVLQYFTEGINQNKDEVMVFTSYPRPPLDISADIRSHMDVTFMEEVCVHVTQPTTLKDSSVLTIRQSLEQYMHQDEGKVDKYTGFTSMTNCTDSCLAENSLSDISDPLAMDHKSVLLKLKESGVHLGKYHCLDRYVALLPLPTAMKGCVIGRGQLEDILCDIWRVFESSI